MSTETLTRLIISGIFIVSYVAIMFAWIWTPHAALADDKVTAALLGLLTSGVLIILNFWFGSSSRGNT